MGKLLDWLEAAKVVVGKLLPADWPPVVKVLILLAIEIAERVVSTRDGAALDGLTKNQLATEMVMAGLNARVGGTDRADDPLLYPDHGVSEADVSEAISRVVDESKAAARAVAAASTKVTKAHAHLRVLPTTQDVATVKAAALGADATRRSLLGA